MAKWKDFKQVAVKHGTKKFALDLLAEISKDATTTWGSALAYAWIFAIFPLMLVMLSLTPYLPFDAKTKVMDELATSISSSIGTDTAETVLTSLNQVMSHSQGGLLSLGILLALWAASGGMSTTMSAIDKAYGVPKERGFFKHRAIALALTISTMLLILLTLILVIAGGLLTDYLARQGVIGSIAWVLLHIIRYVIVLAVLFLVVSTIYYFGPNIKQKWQTITPGAIFTVVVWILTSIGFSIYVSKFGNFNKTYGTLGAAIVMLLFFYINSIVLLVGAEINSLIDFETLGVPVGQTEFHQPWTDQKLDPNATQSPGEPVEIVAKPAPPQKPKRQWGAVAISGAAVVATATGLTLLWKSKQK